MQLLGIVRVALNMACQIFENKIEINSFGQDYISHLSVACQISIWLLTLSVRYI